MLGACCRLVSFPDPTQLSVTCSMEKLKRLAYYLLSCEHYVIRKWQKFAERTDSVLHTVQPTTHSIFSIWTSLMWEKIPGRLPLFSYCKRQKAGWELGGYSRLVLFLTVLFLPITPKTWCVTHIYNTRICSWKHFEQFSNTLTYSRSHEHHVGYVPATSQ